MSRPNSIRKKPLRFRTLLPLSCLSIVCVGAAQAQDPPIYLTENLNGHYIAFPDGTTGSGLRLEDAVLFERRGRDGTELWRSDGTAAGTRLVTNLSPGTTGRSDIEFLAAGPSQGFLWLGAGRNGEDDVRLWSTDGTHVGSRPILSFPSQEIPGIMAFAAAGDHLLISIGLGSYQFPRWLWVSDGTADGTHRLKGAAPLDILQLGDRAVFFRPGLDGQRLFVSDGTVDGTVDLGPVPGLTGEPRELTRRGDHFYFVERSAETDSASLWISDGTVAGTLRLNALPGSRNLSQLVVVGDRLYGVQHTDQGSPLFVSDGSENGTRAAPELWPQSEGTKQLMAAGPHLYVYADDAPPSLDGLWRLDPLLFDHLRLTDGRATDFSVLGGRLAYSTELGRYVTDGTSAGTHSLYDLGIRPLPVDLGGTFVGDCHVDEIEYLCAADSELRNPSPLVKLSRDRETRPSNLSTWRDRLYFSAPYANRYTWGAYYEFRSDGGMTQLQSGQGSQTSFMPGDDNLYLNSPLGLTAWTEDGDVHWLGNETRYPKTLGVLDDRYIYLETEDVVQIRALAPGLSPELVFDPFPDGPPDERSSIAGRRGVNFGQRLYFSAAFHENGPALLAGTDGTVAGTAVVKEFAMSPPDIAAPDHMPEDFVAADGYFYFTAVEVATGRELWRSDGTRTGTVQVADLTPGSASSEIRLPVAVDAGLAFVRDDSLGPELWLSKPGTAPRLLVKLGAADEIHELTSTAGRIYFAATTAELGRELWVSDGSPDGTEALDLFPGPRSSGASSLAPLDDGVFFAADDPEEKGEEPWVSAGDRRSTRRLVDLYPGPGSSSPSQAVRSQNRIYFSAEHPDVGRELFYVELAELGPVSQCPQDSFCPQGGRFEVRFEWRTESESGVARQVTSEGDSALYWFFTPDNWESMVKVLDGCEINGHFWVFAATSSDVGYTLKVTDRDTGEVRSYTNPVGNAAPAVTDSTAFATCL